MNKGGVYQCNHEEKIGFFLQRENKIETSSEIVIVRYAENRSKRIGAVDRARTLSVRCRKEIRRDSESPSFIG